MNRRGLLFLDKIGSGFVVGEPSVSLKKYSGVWNQWTTAHLLRRVCFGFTKDELKEGTELGMDRLVDKLLTPQPLNGEPVYIYKDDSGLVYGESFYDKNPDSTYYSRMIFSHFGWWFGKILTNRMSITQKMMLFWHNHFVIETFAANDAYHFQSYFELLAEEAIGNCKSIAEKMTINPEMLVYLNGNTNVVGKPNENYARELFELFTIGKGPQIDEGNYTNYTESDIVAAAKVLTGWSTQRGQKTANYNSKKHDKTDKQFSAAFNNRVITNEEADEYKELIAMIFEQKETARNFCRKIYRWFVHYKIDDEIESNIIEPLATILIRNNYDIKPVLETLLKSEHFYDINFRGSMVKDPASFILSLIKTFEVKFPEPIDANSRGLLHQLWFSLYYDSAVLEMSLGNPPSVAGYPAYYQSPVYYRVWVSSVTIQYRQQLSDSLISSKGLTRYKYSLAIDPLGFVKDFEWVADVEQFIEEISVYLFPFPITANQKDYLKQALLGTVPDYEWAKKWSDYKANPDDNNLIAELSTKLRNFFKTAFSLAEFQLM